MNTLRQLLVGASAGDAVTTSALEIAALLPDGADGGTFAHHIEPSMARQVRPLAELDALPGNDGDVVLLHVSIGDREVEEVLARRPERLAVCYHNISPADPFRPWDPAFADLLDLGRHQLAVYAGRAELALADSEYNAAELRALGVGDVRVTPLVYDPNRLLDVEPDPPTATHLAERVEGPVILAVSQVLPHKRPDLLIAAYHVLVTHLQPDAHLILVGPARLEGYRAALQEAADELGLLRFWMTGAVSDAALAAFYRRADLYISASQHEGFGAPLLEAMAFDLPVVARRLAATPETAGDAALLLDPGDGPSVMAEAAAGVLADPALRADLVARGRARLGCFTAEAARRRMAGHLADLLDA